MAPLAGWPLSEDQICMSPVLMVSGGKIPGVRERKKEGGKKLHGSAETEGWTAQDGTADKQNAPSVSISVTFGHSAVALLHAKQRG